MSIDISYFKKIQGNYDFNKKRDAQIEKVKQQEIKHFYDTYGTEHCFVNNKPQDLIVMKKTMYKNKKEIIAKPNEDFYLGDYVDCYGKRYLVTEIDENNKIHRSGVMTECNFLFHWQNSKGEVIERYGVADDVSARGEGIEEGKTISIPSFQQNIQLPFDNETFLLDINRRIMPYYRDRKYTKMLRDNHITIPVMQLTNRNPINKTYDDKGILQFTYSQVPFNPNTDCIYDEEYNGKYDLICDYRPIDTTPEPVPTPIVGYSCEITPTTDLKCMGARKEYYVKVYSDDIEVQLNTLNNLNITWNVESKTGLTVEEATDKSYVQLYTRNKKLIGDSVNITVIVEADGVNCTVTENIKISKLGG